MICIEAMWLAVEPVDMRAGTERLLMSVVQIFGAAHMLDLRTLTLSDLCRLAPLEKDALMLQLLAHIGQQTEVLQAHQTPLEQRDQAIRFKDARIEKITFELQRLKRWQFGANTDRMTAEQRQLFEDALVEGLEGPQSELDALLGDKQGQDSPDRQRRRRPRREAPPEHLRRVEHHHEPQDTTCECGLAMVRIGQDVSERLDIVPAQFFVHHHIRGKWACKCCEKLVQEPANPQIIDSGIPTAALVAHLSISRFVDHLPCYRIEKINARSGVHTPRSTLAAWGGTRGRCAHAAVRGAAQVRAERSGAARGRDAGQHAGSRRGQDEEGLRLGPCAQRVRCAAKFEELQGQSTVAAEAVRRFGQIYRIERAIAKFDARGRLEARRRLTVKRWEALHDWLRLERKRVDDGSATAGALDYSLRRWTALSGFLEDDVAFDNSHLENHIRPWAVGRKGWLFAGSELAASAPRWR